MGTLNRKSYNVVRIHHVLAVALMGFSLFSAGGVHGASSEDQLCAKLNPKTKSVQAGSTVRVRENCLHSEVEIRSGAHEESIDEVVEITLDTVDQLQSLDERVTRMEKGFQRQGSDSEGECTCGDCTQIEPCDMDGDGQCMGIIMCAVHLHFAECSFACQPCDGEDDRGIDRVNDPFFGDPFGGDPFGAGDPFGPEGPEVGDPIDPDDDPRK